MIRLKDLITEAEEKETIWMARYDDYDIQFPHDAIGFTRASNEKEARKSLGVGTGNRFNGKEISVESIGESAGTLRYHKTEGMKAVKSLQKLLKSLSSL